LRNRNVWHYTCGGNERGRAGRYFWEVFDGKWKSAIDCRMERLAALAAFEKMGGSFDECLAKWLGLLPPLTPLAVLAVFDWRWGGGA
jgi:hypothetical protein